MHRGTSVTSMTACITWAIRAASSAPGTPALTSSTAAPAATWSMASWRTMSKSPCCRAASTFLRPVGLIRSPMITVGRSRRMVTVWLGDESVVVTALVIRFLQTVDKNGRRSGLAHVYNFNDERLHGLQQRLFGNLGDLERAAPVAGVFAEKGVEGQDKATGLGDGRGNGGHGAFDVGGEHGEANAALARAHHLQKDLEDVRLGDNADRHAVADDDNAADLVIDHDAR